MHLLRGVWAYRYFIISSIRTEFRSRFARSKLGGLWMVLHPLALVLIYALVLSQVMAAKLPNTSTQYAYPIYILSGMLGWTLFSEVLGKSSTVFIDNGNLLKKMAFPKLTLPLITVGTALVNFMLFFLVMCVVFGFLGHLPFHAVAWLPVLVAITVGLGVGIGLFFGILNVFMRDVGQMLTVILQFWFWLTPVVYMSSIVPQKYQALLMLNPMTGVTLGYQSVLLYDEAPNAGLLLYPSIVAVAFIILALFTFKKANKEMADVL